jgi:hypothetical protein
MGRGLEEQSSVYVGYPTDAGQISACKLRSFLYASSTTLRLRDGFQL